MKLCCWNGQPSSSYIGTLMKCLMKSLTQNYSWHLIFIFNVRNNNFFIWWSFKIEFFIKFDITEQFSIDLCVRDHTVSSPETKWMPRQQTTTTKRKKEKNTKVLSGLVFVVHPVSVQLTTSRHWHTCKERDYFSPTCWKHRKCHSPLSSTFKFVWSRLGPCKVFSLRAESNINHCGRWLLAASLSVYSIKSRAKRSALHLHEVSECHCILAALGVAWGKNTRLF